MDGYIGMYPYIHIKNTYMYINYTRACVYVYVRVYVHIHICRDRGVSVACQHVCHKRIQS